MKLLQTLNLAQLRSTIPSRRPSSCQPPSDRRDIVINNRTEMGWLSGGACIWIYILCTHAYIYI